MPSKRQLEQLKNAQLVTQSKKRKIGNTTAQPGINNNQLFNVGINDTDDLEKASETWFWNLSANKLCSDSEEGSEEERLEERRTEEGGPEEGGPEEKEGLLEKPRSEKVAPPRNAITEIRWNKKGENKLRSGYGKGSRTTKKKQRKFMKELEKKTSKTHDIMALWKRNRDVGLISKANNQPGLDKNLALGPNDELNLSSSLFLTLSGFIISQSYKK